jgi:hypothetical protein
VLLVGYLGEEVTEDEMGGACFTCWGEYFSNEGRRTL